MEGREKKPVTNPEDGDVSHLARETLGPEVSKKVEGGGEGRRGGGEGDLGVLEACLKKNERGGKGPVKGEIGKNSD